MQWIESSVAVIVNDDGEVLIGLLFILSLHSRVSSCHLLQNIEYKTFDWHLNE